MEVLQITEEIEVLKIEVAKSVDLIRSLAWEEVNNKEETKRRIDKLIRRENPMMSAEGLELAVHQAVAGSAERVGQLDVRPLPFKIMYFCPELFIHITNRFCRTQDVSPPRILSRNSRSSLIQ